MRGLGEANRLDGEYPKEKWALPPECCAALHNSFRRICSWRVPPNWSISDWFEEIKAHGVAASLEALRDYDAGRAVPLEAFVYQRVIARVLTRHRQEWRYAVRVVPEGGANSIPTGSNPLRNGSTKHNAAVIIVARRVYEPLLDAVASLPKPSRLLIQQLFWQERTEREISQALRIGRRAVNKRKHAILRSLHATLKVSAETTKERLRVPKAARRSIIILYKPSLGLTTNEQER